jgi:SpoVK/Ycf46/Vps4 family AAA+-type ATPase
MHRGVSTMSVNAIDIISDKIRRLTFQYNNAQSGVESLKMQQIAIEIADNYNHLAEINPIREKELRQYAYLWEKKAVERKTISTSSDNSISMTDFAESLKFNSPITFDDIGGCDKLKSVLTKTLVLSEINGLPHPVKTSNILLFGPPGTGKTLIANALANYLRRDNAFYNASIESLLSKYYGQASKQISALFDGARQNSAKSIIFLDEFDALGSARDNGGDSDANNKVVTSLLLELDGSKAKNNPAKQPLTIGACNHPWSVDEALLSRFRKRIYVDLPNTETVVAIINIQIRGYTLSPEVDLNKLSEECVNRYYSGRDLEGLCSVAVESMIDDVNPGYDVIYATMTEAERKQFRISLRPLNNGDFAEGLANIQSPITSDLLKQYESWTNDYGVKV